MTIKFAKTSSRQCNTSNLPRCDAVVVITQRRLTHYRVPFFESLRRELSARHVQLVVVYGQPDPSEVARNDSATLGWGVEVLNRYFRIGRTYVAWQPLPISLRNVDLLVITQENRILSNLVRIMLRRFFALRIAFWGHGANLQSSKPSGFKERIKRDVSTRVDWWFAYTSSSAKIVADAGFDPRRITILNNAIDTTDMRRTLEEIPDQERVSLRNRLGFSSGPVGVYIGTLYAEKQLDFLLSAAELIKARVPEFCLVIIGDGPERIHVEEWCARRQWAAWVGALYGREKVVCLSLGSLMLNPGAVGLNVLDSFTCGIPLITQRSVKHGPEISYINDGVNGVLVDGELDHYVSRVVQLLGDQSKLDKMSEECISSAKEYTVEVMAQRFAAGIVAAISP